MTAWLRLAATVVAACALCYVLHLPTPMLFGGLLGGLAYALVRPAEPVAVPAGAGRAGLAVLGVVVGACIDWASLASLGWDWLAVTATCGVSLVLSIRLGQRLTRHGVSSATAAFSLVPGGAASLTALADELGADARVVAVLQYLRLIIVLVTMPAVVLLVFDARIHGHDAPSAGLAVSLAYVAASIAVGYPLAGLLRVPSAAIFGPLVVSSLLRLHPTLEGAAVPALVAAAAYLVIGLQVGVRFTVASVRAISRILGSALLVTATTLATCALLGWLLTLVTDVSGLDAYLATTPGGVYAVLGVVTATGGDAGFVAAAQGLRLLLVVGCAPLLAAYLRRTATD